jgi:hypothetical protein
VCDLCAAFFGSMRLDACSPFAYKCFRVVFAALFAMLGLIAAIGGGGWPAFLVSVLLVVRCSGGAFVSIFL